MSQKGKLYNNNAPGVNVQLHAHQLHNNNIWGINRVIILAPMVFNPCDLKKETPSGLTSFQTKSEKLGPVDFKNTPHGSWGQGPLGPKD